MKVKRRPLILLLVLFSTIFFSGCWNYNDIEKYSLVAGFAIDRDKKENKYIVNVEVLNFEMTGKEAKTSPKIIESKGDTVFDAIRNTINITGKRLYWGHAKLIIISKDIAEEGVIPVLDLPYRNHELRSEMNVLVSKTTSAKDLLKQETMTTDLRSFEIDKMLEGQKGLSKIPKVMVYQMVGTLQEEGISAAVPVASLVTNTGKRTLELKGTAMFKADKLVGFLDEKESQSFLFIINHFRRGVLIESINDNNQVQNITIEVLRSTTRIKPEYSQGRVVMNIDISPIVKIAEVETQEDYIGIKGREKLKQIAEESLKLSIEKVIKKVQSDYDADIFGFGRIIKADMPSTWRSIESKWDNIFRTLVVNINVNIDIKNSSISSKSIKVGK